MRWGSEAGDQSLLIGVDRPTTAVCLGTAVWATLESGVVCTKWKWFLPQGQTELASVEFAERCLTLSEYIEHGLQVQATRTMPWYLRPKKVTVLAVVTVFWSTPGTLAHGECRHLLWKLPEGR